ncbi:MAG: TonB-dependent receptor, partial [Bacteroidales bacterium]|nr:TonB-dependent receptor [Bacteroidales bacterium]
NCPLDYRVIGNVFVIFERTGSASRPLYIVAGRVRDRQTGESLPFSHINTEGKWIVTDFMGQFSLTTRSEPPYSISVSYLGYHNLDTMLQGSSDLDLLLDPQNIAIEEVVVRSGIASMSVQGNQDAGELKLNHIVARYLPGNGDNSVFNLLRLQPGITASGELSNDLIIWGSYEGQSRLLFDRFTIFGLKNFNENISSVNPFMAKDIRVLKGGYDSYYGGRVGGIVDITGVEGARESPDVKLMVNNLTLNGYLSVPVGNSHSVAMAFRQTYYDLYSSSTLSMITERGPGSKSVGGFTGLTVQPDYLFRDFNLKVSGDPGNNFNWYLSLYAGGDNFSYRATQESMFNITTASEAEESLQHGASLYAGTRWGRGHITRATVSYSGLNAVTSDFRSVERLIPPGGNGGAIGSGTGYIFDYGTATALAESEVRIDNTFNIPGIHSLEAGAGVTFNTLDFREDTAGVTISGQPDHNLISSFYLTDIITPAEGIVVKPGLRVDHSGLMGKIFFQPRVSFKWRFAGNFGFNLAAGRYTQFMAPASSLDESGNLRYLWTIADDHEVKVLSSNHYLAGVSYNSSSFMVSAEGYYKTINGITRYLQEDGAREAYTGEGRSYGADLSARIDILKHQLWLSYSLGRSTEYFPWFEDDIFRSALHDQRHELKIALLADIDPLYLSGSWVYGSGFLYPYLSEDGDPLVIPYNRLDMSVMYRLSRDKYRFDAGLSLLNIFDTENIKYSNLTLVDTGETDPLGIHAEALPRTLALFILFSF